MIGSDRDTGYPREDLTTNQNIQNHQEEATDKNLSGTITYSEKAKEPVRIDTGESGDEFAGFATVVDPFEPFDNLPEERQWILTTRAVIIGILAGTLVNASNLYIGLKSGWVFGASLFGAISGFGIIKICSKLLPETFPILGGSFGPRENNIVQTTATAAGGMSSVFVTAFPAMYQLHLLKSPQEDLGRIICVTAVAGFFGLFFATPLRKFFIVYLARELQLIFPTPLATALTIRSMHDAAKGETVGLKKMRAMAYSFCGATILRVVSQYAPGILWEWHPFAWFYMMGHYANLAIYPENWGWFLEFTPAFIGSGMLVGLNVALSFFGGSVLAWGIIGPSLVHQRLAFGDAPYKNPDSEFHEHWKDLVQYTTLRSQFTNKDHPSVRYWIIWPGVLAMIAISFTELLLQWRMLFYAFKAVARALTNAIYDIGLKAGKDLKFLKMKPQDETNMIQDPAHPSEIPPMWTWGAGLILTIVGMIVVMAVQFEMPVGITLLSLFLAFFFSFLAIQCSGVTDITPLTAASKASQIVLGGATKSQGWPLDKAQRLNLIGGALASVSAGQSSDLVGDFRVGFLLRTPVNQQWMAQGIGTIVAVFMAPLLFLLFMKAYPCVLDSNFQGTCMFSAPSASAWKAVAVAATDPQLPIPASSGVFAIVFAIFGSLMVIIRNFVWVGKLEWVRNYHPNMMCVSLAFTLDKSVYGSAMVIGALISHIWSKKHFKSWELLGYAVAAGLIAGEGIGGVINAILELAGVSGEKYGSNVLCPGVCSG